MAQMVKYKGEMKNIQDVVDSVATRLEALDHEEAKEAEAKEKSEKKPNAQKK